MIHIQPHQLKTQLSSEEKITFLDVREPMERDICHIADSLFIPMMQVPQNIDSIPRDHQVIVHCHHGIRSQQVIHWLEQFHRFTNLINLEGGIDRWAIEMDPSMQRY